MKDLESSKKWVLLQWSLKAGKPLALVVCIFGLTALAGYFGKVEPLYRPIPNGPATNPLTALSLVLLAFSSMLSIENKHLITARTIALFALLCIGCRLVDITVGATFSEMITPFQSIVRYELEKGQNNAMGMNSAIMLFALGGALLLHSFRFLAQAQLIAFLALAIPFVSYTGYAYGFEKFYGQMSLLTASVGIVLSLSLLMSTADRGGMKGVLSPYIGGKIARIQMFLGGGVPFLLGALFVKTILTTEEQGIFGIFVVSIIWFISFLVITSAYFQERSDQRRREAEAEVLRHATVDSLTKLFNRRHFIELSQKEFERSKRYQAECGFLMLDIDHFKKINDTAGHDMGDRILKQVGKTLMRSLRTVDVVGRLGGEEFGIMLTDAPAPALKNVAEKIRTSIEALSIKGWTDIYGPITISIGISLFVNHASLEAMMKSADMALYKAKENGRNQFCIEEVSPSKGK